MSTKTKTITAAAVAAAVALPTGALAADGKGKGHEKHGDTQAEHQPGHGKQKSKSKAGSKGKGFTLAGVDVANLNVTDGKLTAPIVIDPTSANRQARTLLKLTKDELRGEDTVEVGTADDAVVVKFRGLTATDTLLPTDVVKIQGKVDRRTGALDVKSIKVVREAADTDED